MKKETTGERNIDKLAKETYSWFGQKYVFIKKAEIKTWKAIFIVAFLAGMVAAIALSFSTGFHIFTKAEANASALALSPGTISVTQNQSFSLNVLLDTKGNNVVAVKAIVDYDTQKFSLSSYDTSGSIFSSSNTCVYQGKACEIDSNQSGEITITLAKPTPGVNTSSGLIVKLNFTALQTSSASSSGIKINYSAPGVYTDSDVIVDDAKGTDILSGVSGATITVNAPACTSISYSDWTACQSSGTQTRTVSSSSPSGCDASAAVLSQSCTYTAPTCASFTYSSWGTCQPDNTQSRTVSSSSPSGCAGGNPVLSQSCQYSSGTSSSVTCTSFTYSSWGTCQSNNTQTRTVSSSSPSGCTGGKPVLSRTCWYRGYRKR